jgi:hypothetical protein
MVDEASASAPFRDNSFQIMHRKEIKRSATSPQWKCLHIINQDNHSSRNNKHQAKHVDQQPPTPALLFPGQAISSVQP